jgi:hypothetical protein
MIIKEIGSRLIFVKQAKKVFACFYEKATDSKMLEEKVACDSFLTIPYSPECT